MVIVIVATLYSCIGSCQQASISIHVCMHQSYLPLALTDLLSIYFFLLPSVIFRTTIMDEQLQMQGSATISYRNVQLVKNEANTLGIGSYGAVYRAKYNQLPCAAKILHPILFSTRDPAGRRIIDRFEQECEFLNGIRHPNVIQYLGVYRDPESRLPVLLMELMDESLTRFLERVNDPPPLPFHVQVSIAHDVAQALAYLHSISILHRDLSSNNVLLIGSSRAKVTDFGMAKLAGSNPRVTPTYCPGTMVYMSPEALREPPFYTINLDIFSFGVLQIQIITRKFPDPGPRLRQVELNDPRFSFSPVQVLVPERERRRSHIDKIDPTHPLLLLALECLRDGEDKRPTAVQMCSHLNALMLSPRFQESLQEEQATPTMNEQLSNVRETEHEREVMQLNGELTQQLEESRSALQAKERSIETLSETVEQLQQQSHRQAQVIQQKRIEIEQKDRDVQHTEAMIQHLSNDLDQNQKKFQELKQDFQKSKENHKKILNSLQQTLEQKEKSLQEKEEMFQCHDKSVRAYYEALLEKERRKRQEISQSQNFEVRDMARKFEQLQLQSERNEHEFQYRERDVQEKERELQYKSVEIQHLRFELRQKEQQVHVMTRQIVQLEHTLQQKDNALVAQDVALTVNKKDAQQKLHTTAAVPPLRLCWQNGTNTPLPILGESSAVAGKIAYFYSWWHKKILLYNSEIGTWAILPKLPRTHFSIAVINMVLTAIGGKQGDASTKTLVSLSDQQKWMQQFPAMKHYHNNSAIACTGTHLIVAGGYGPDEKLAPVEVMDILTKHWLTATNLPYSWRQASSTVCDDKMFIAGGFAKGSQTKSVIMCNLRELLHSTAPQFSRHSTHCVWREIATLPVYHSTLVSFEGELYAVGGCEADRSPSSEVYRYKMNTNSWTICSQMKIKRYQCFAVPISNKLLVVGGFQGDRDTDSVEIASFA